MKNKAKSKGAVDDLIGADNDPRNGLFNQSLEMSKRDLLGGFTERRASVDIDKES